MKKILVILDGIVAKKLLQRIVQSNTGDNYYDVIYLNDLILPEKKPSNFTFYKFDPTSPSKLAMVLDKNIHSEALIALNSKDEMLSVIANIKDQQRTLQMNILDYWGIELEDPYVNIYKGIEVLANGMVERLPNYPVIAQNIGLKQGEIMEIRIPFGSSYAYRYIGSIEQKDWKIFGLYRNEKMINIKPSLILKPNDVILVIGKPKVLMQVYNAIGKNQGQFPMPFGHNIYLYLDAFLQEETNIIQSIEEAKHLNNLLKNRKLIIRITRPTNVKLMKTINDAIMGNDSILLQIDYKNSGFETILRDDRKRLDIGMIMLSYEFFQDITAMQSLTQMKIPILKLGKEKIQSVKETFVLVNDINSYEQISPIIFDVSSQIKAKTKIFDMDPIGDEKKLDLIDHFESLAKIFNQKIEVVAEDKNPIRELKKQENILQIMPLKKDMFAKRYFYQFFYTNSDVLAFDIEKYNQLLIPVVEE